MYVEVWKNVNGLSLLLKAIAASLQCLEVAKYMHSISNHVLNLRDSLVRWRDEFPTLP